MGLYCIGDLHGRYDLFLMALEKINFDIENDKMYILGDVIDGNYGAIEIFRYIMKYQNSFELILGNHETNFKYKETIYDIFMLNGEAKEIVTNIVDNCVKDYINIGMIIYNNIRNNDTTLIEANEDIKKWVKVSKKREVLLTSIISLIKYLDYDQDTFYNFNRLFFSMHNQWKTKPFIKELLEIDANEYLLLKKYIFSKPTEIKLTYLGKKIWLTHNLTSKSYVLSHISDMRIKNSYVIYGHEPVTKIHRELIGRYFNFNYREVFSYIDRMNNHYYDLDMTDNCAAVLRLEDFEEFYVIKYKNELNKNVVTPPMTPVQDRKVGYKLVESTLPINKRPRGFSFVTFKDYCYEFIIGVNVLKKRIYYAKIDCLYPNRDVFYTDNIIIINDWYEEQPIKTIIDKVKTDYNSQMHSQNVLWLERFIRGKFD